MKFLKYLIEQKSVLHYDEIIKALSSYTSLSKNPNPLLKLIKKNYHLEFMKYTQSMLKNKSLLGFRGVSTFSLVDNIDYKEDWKDLIVPLGVISSWSVDKPATEYAKTHIMLSAQIPVKFILAAQKATEGFCIKSENEVIVLNRKFKVLKVFYDTDYRTGAMLNIKVQGVII